jgi:hypothetical protein
MKRFAPTDDEVMAVAEQFLANLRQKSKLSPLFIKDDPGPDGTKLDHDLVIGTYEMNAGWRVLQVMQKSRPQFDLQVGILVMRHGRCYGSYLRTRCTCEECALIGLDTVPDAMHLLDVVSSAMSSHLRLVEH